MSATHCSGPHGIGGMTPVYNKGEIIPGYQVHVYRYFGNKILRAEIDNQIFPDYESAQKEILRRGYGCWHFRRSSIPLPVFAKLEHCQEAARFDSLYRLYKWTQKQQEIQDKYVKIIKLRNKLIKLAKKIGIFHPCTKNFC